MIATRTQQQMTPEEESAIRAFFRNHPELGSGVESTPSEQLMHNANRFEDYLKRWNVVVTDESLQASYEKLRAVENILKITSEAKLKYAEAARGYTQADQDTLDEFLKRYHLVHDPADDRTFENCTHLFNAMKGREFNESNLAWCLQYLQGRGGRGTNLHWEARPSQNPPQNRGHAHIPGERWMPKEETNRSFYPSHSSNPRFNGQAEREERERMKRFLEKPEAVDAANGYWLAQAKSLVGSTHAETQRIQRVVDSTPGGPRRQHEAGLKELRRIENERARGR